MDKILEKIYATLGENLYLSCPVLSGNMRNHIDVKTVLGGAKEITIVISAPFYDQKEWDKNRKIVLTGEVKNGKHDYAEEVNTFGPFGKPGKSQYWVNRSCYEVAQVIANETGAVVINELPL